MKYEFFSVKIIQNKQNFKFFEFYQSSYVSICIKFSEVYLMYIERFCFCFRTIEMILFVMSMRWVIVMRIATTDRMFQNTVVRSMYIWYKCF